MYLYIYLTYRIQVTINWYCSLSIECCLLSVVHEPINMWRLKYVCHCLTGTIKCLWILALLNLPREEYVMLLYRVYLPLSLCLHNCCLSLHYCQLKNSVKCSIGIIFSDKHECCTFTSLSVLPSVQIRVRPITFLGHLSNSGDLLLCFGVRRRPLCINIFFSKTTGPILTKFGM